MPQRTLKRIQLVHVPVCSFCAVVLLVICFSKVEAIPLEAYRKNVEQVIGGLDSLNVRDEQESFSQHQVRFIETLNSVRTVLPAKQRVEFGDATLDIDNEWLHKELEGLQRASETERPRLLRWSLERLKALDERLSELERSAGKPFEEKSSAKKRLEEILARAEYAKKPEETSALSRLWQRFLRWLSTLFGSRKPVQGGSTQTITKLAQIFVVVLALAVIGYALRVFAPKLRRKRTAKKTAKREPRVVLGERLEADQSAIDLLSEAETLARNGDVRGAIRKAYISLLVELGDRNIISLAQHKTNRDYLRAVIGRDTLYRKMGVLTDVFERHWYGLSAASDTDWMDFRARYREVLQQ